MKDNDWKILSTMKKYESLTKTAEALFITQPALTKRLRLMEEELGVTIVKRTSQGIIFTTEGEFLVKKAEEHLKWLDVMHNELKTLKLADKKTIKIAMSYSVLRFYFPLLQQNFEKSHSDIKLETSYFKSGEVIKLVENNEVDIGFIRGNLPYKGNRHLFAMDYGYIIYSKPFTMEELSFVPEIDYERDPSSYKLINKWWKQNFDAPPCNKIMVPNVDMSREMVLKGLGFNICFVPGNFSNISEISSLPMYWKDDTPFQHPSWIICNPEIEKIPAVKSFIDFVKTNKPVY